METFRLQEYNSFVRLYAPPGAGVLYCAQWLVKSFMHAAIIVTVIIYVFCTHVIIISVPISSVVTDVD